MTKLLLSLAIAAIMLSGTSYATEIDFGTKILDLDGAPYKDCSKIADNKKDCDEWTDHTLGIIAYSALDRPAEPNTSMTDQARRGGLARKVYPGKREQHIVDLSSSEISLIIDQIAKLGLRPVEAFRVIELLDPARLKSASN